MRIVAFRALYKKKNAELFKTARLQTWSMLVAAFLWHHPWALYKPTWLLHSTSQFAFSQVQQTINMKFIVLAALACLLAASVVADKEEKMLGSAYGGGGYGQPAAAPAAPSYSAPAAPSYAAPAAPSYSAPAPVSIPAPPCPKNYLFSCQPNLAPVPCSAPAPSYGSAGAYSHYAPVFSSRPMY